MQRRATCLHLTLCIILRRVQYWNSSYLTLNIYINTVIILANDYVSSILIMERYDNIPLQYNTNTYIELSLPKKMLICDESCWYLTFIFQISATSGLYLIYFVCVKSPCCVVLHIIINICIHNIHFFTEIALLGP